MVSSDSPAVQRRELSKVDWLDVVERGTVLLALLNLEAAEVADRKRKLFEFLTIPRKTPAHSDPLRPLPPAVPSGLLGF